MIRKGTIITPNYNDTDIVAGKHYVTIRDSKEGYAIFEDDAGYVRHRGCFTVVSDGATLTDIRGNTVCVRDTIAYAFAGAAYRHLALFEVQQVNGQLALCRSLKDGAVINLGVFEERAIIIK